MAKIDNFSIIADVSTLNNPSFKSTDVKVYPNPFNNKLTIQLSNNMINDNLNLSIYDISGRVIMNFDDLLLKGNQIALTNFDCLASGWYFIKLTNNTRFRQKFLKIMLLKWGKEIKISLIRIKSMFRIIQSIPFHFNLMKN